MAIDGDSFSRWSSTATDPQWITVYLGGLKSFDTVRLLWEAAYGKNYRIDISTNNTSWTTIKTVTNGDGNVDELYVGPQSASYVRMYGTLRGTAWGYSLWEMEVLQSSTTRATASSENGAFPAAHAVDANPRSRWASIANDNQWLSIDWGAPKTFNRVHLLWEAAFASSYMISASTDNTNWSIIAVITGGDGGVDDIEVSSQTARYLKFTGVSRNNPAWGYSLYEMSAYWADKKTTAAPTTGSAGSIANLTDLAQIQAAITAHWGKVLTDPNGNAIIARDKWCKFDAENRLSRVVTSSGVVTDFVYDHEGTRVKKITGGITTLYIGDIYEKTGSVGTTHLFANGRRIAQKTGAVITYFHPDHLGGTHVITDALGKELQRTTYKPFGAPFTTTGQFTSINYTGHRLDDSAGLIFMKARYYDPLMGRFISPDSIVAQPYNPQNLNRYAYVDNNPVNFTDPTGHWKFKNFLREVGNVTTAFMAVTNPVSQIGLGINAAAGKIHNMNDAFRYNYQSHVWGAGIVAAYMAGSFIANGWVGGTEVEAAGWYEGSKFVSYGSKGAQILGWGAGIGGGASIGYNLWPRENEDKERINTGPNNSNQNLRLLASAGMRDDGGYDPAFASASKAAEFIRKYGSVDLNFNAGSGLFGINGSLTVNSSGIYGTVGGGWGIGGGISIGASGSVGDSAGFGLTFSMTGGSIAGGSITGIISRNGKSFSGSAGLGMGAGGSITIGYTGKILEW